MSWRDTVKKSGGWRSTITAKPKGQETGPAQTALESFGDVVSFGYLPQLQAAAEKVTTPIFETVTGQEVEPSSYVEERDAAIRRMKRGAKLNPKSAATGAVGGLAASALATPGFGLAKGLLGAAGKGALTGGFYGAVQNPGDVEGVVDPLQLEAREAGAKKGALMGGLIGGGMKAGEKVAGVFRKAPGSLQKAAESEAVRQTGVMLKEMRAIQGRGQTGKLGKWLLDNKVVQAGDSFDDVAAKAKAIKDRAGAELDDIYSNAYAKAQKNIEKLPPEKAAKYAEQWAKAGFSPARDKDKLVAMVAEKMKGEVDGQSAVRAVENYLDELIEGFGDKQFTPKMANEIKSAIDRKINYARNPLSKQPQVEKAFQILRRNLAATIEKEISLLGKMAGEKKAAARLKATNQNFGFAKQVGQIAEDKLNREMVNASWGLLDRTGAAAGAGIGAGVGALATGDFQGSGIGSVVGGAGLGLLSNVGRARGHGVAAKTLSGLGKAARVISPVAGAVERALQSPALQRGLIRGAVNE